MKILFLSLFLVSFLCIPAYSASSLTDPHYGRLYSCGQKHLIQKKVIVTFIDKTHIIGRVIDYGQNDCLILNQMTGKLMVLPLTSVISFSIIEDKE